ncbi:MAG: hypothetical protein II620_05750 [Paludibacteraceae bacterium]|nr:hypothetical protein [Paludibacteraceae bacterium]
MKNLFLRLCTIILSFTDIFLLIIMVMCVLFTIIGDDMDFPATMAAYLGSWAPEWIFYIPILLLLTGFIMLIADNESWIAWTLHLVALIIPLCAGALEKFVYISPEPSWNRGTLPFQPVEFYIMVCMFCISLFGLILTNKNSVTKKS